MRADENPGRAQSRREFLERSLAVAGAVALTQVLPANYRFCVETARSGRIGKLQTIVNRMGGSPGPTAPRITAPPPDIDYNLWLGPAPLAPYSDTRVSGAFRFISDYAGGSMTDMGAHYNDIAQHRGEGFRR